MHASLRSMRSLVLGLLLLPTVLMLAGCKGKEPEPSTSGYYEGPMKPKGSVTKGEEGKTSDSNDASKKNEAGNP